MTAYEEYWDTLLLMWDNPALLEMLENTCYTTTIVSDEHKQWAEEV